MRALRNEFDPYRQVMNRLEHYIAMGQNPEKVELIIFLTVHLVKTPKDLLQYATKGITNIEIPEEVDDVKVPTEIPMAGEVTFVEMPAPAFKKAKKPTFDFRKDKK